MPSRTLRPRSSGLQVRMAPARSARVAGTSSPARPRQRPSGFGWLDAVHREDREPSRASLLAAIARRVPFTLEHRVRGADGEYRGVISAGRPRFSASGEFVGYSASVIDIHDRKQAEEQLRQGAKMEAIGRLAGGIAHDFNNQLNAVSGFAALRLS